MEPRESCEELQVSGNDAAESCTSLERGHENTHEKTARSGVGSFVDGTVTLGAESFYQHLFTTASGELEHMQQAMDGLSGRNKELQQLFNTVLAQISQQQDGQVPGTDIWKEAPASIAGQSLASTKPDWLETKCSSDQPPAAPLEGLKRGTTQEAIGVNMTRATKKLNFDQQAASELFREKKKSELADRRARSEEECYSVEAQFQRIKQDAAHARISPEDIICLYREYGEEGSDVCLSDLTNVCLFLNNKYCVAENGVFEDTHDAYMSIEMFSALVGMDEETVEPGHIKATIAHLKQALCAEERAATAKARELKQRMKAKQIKDLIAVVFDIVVVIVILMNSLVIGISIDVDPESVVWDIVEICFFTFYIIECLLKLCCMGVKGYFCGKDLLWNWFDIACLGTQAVDVVTSYMSASSGQAGWPLIKLFRLARLSRLLRLLRFKLFCELKLMVFGLFSGLRALFWAIILLIFIVYTMGILMRNISNEQEFSDIPSAMFTLFRCFTDDCTAYDGTPLAERLRDEHGFLFFASYVLVTMAVTVGLFNLIMAVFIDNVTQSQARRKQREISASHADVCAKLQLQIVKLVLYGALVNDEEEGHDLERVSDEARHRLHELISLEQGFWRDAGMAQSLADTSFEILTDDGVVITREMFLLWLNDEEFTNVLDDADIDVSDKWDMFDILDVDMRGELSAEDLVTGLVQLRGDVTKGNVVSVMLKVGHLTKKIEEVQRMLQCLIEKT